MIDDKKIQFNSRLSLEKKQFKKVEKLLSKKFREMNASTEKKNKGEEDESEGDDEEEGANDQVEQNEQPTLVEKIEKQSEEKKVAKP